MLDNPVHVEISPRWLAAQEEARERRMREDERRVEGERRMREEERGTLCWGEGISNGGVAGGVTVRVEQQQKQEQAVGLQQRQQRLYDQEQAWQQWQKVKQQQEQQPEQQQQQQQQQQNVMASNIVTSPRRYVSFSIRPTGS